MKNTFDASKIDTSVFIELEQLIPQRQNHLERRKSDEDQAWAHIKAAGEKLKCALMPSFVVPEHAGKPFQMFVVSLLPDSPEAQKNVDAFSDYVVQTTQQAQVTFVPITYIDPATNKREYTVHLFTTW